MNTDAVATFPATRRHRDAMRAKVLSMTIVLVSHNHLLRLTLRQRARAAGPPGTECRVARLDRTCNRCAELSPVLMRSSRAFKTQLTALMAAR